MAEKGKIIVIKDGSGGIVNDPKTGTDYSFAQAYHKELCLGAKDRVKFDILIPKGVATAVAVNVERITAGTVLSTDGLGNGVIEERQSKKAVNFYEPYAVDLGIDVGDIVRYTLINSAKGELAVNLSEVVE